MLECILCSLFIFMLIFMWRRDRKKHYVKHPLLEHVKALVRPLAPKTVDKLKFRESTSTYTLNKQTLYFCIRNDKGEYYDLNTLVYVAIHELSHAVIPYDTKDHGPDWAKKFAQLLDEGNKLGIYDPNKSIAPMYCGINNREPEALPSAAKVA